MPEIRNQPGVPDRERLLRGMAQLEIKAPEGAVDRLLAYAELVLKWSAAYNLVARGDLDALVTRHVLDALSIQPWVSPGKMLDVGAGAGFPGIPLAIADPGLDVTLVDSAGKKVRFMRHVQRTLQLDNIHPVHVRLETYDPGVEFTTITCRAFSSLSDFVTGVRHLAGPQTYLLAMKGQCPDTELDALPEWVEVRSVERICIPDLHAERHLVIMCPSPACT